MREGYKLREILFKAKRVDNNKWEYGLIARIGIETSNIINKEFEILVPVKTKTISQFTGLTDKNGSKIFENDILDISYFLTKYKGVVTFGLNKPFEMTEEYECGNQGFYVETKAPKPNTFRKDLYFYISHSNVIGTIFDNSELIGGL